MIRDPQTPKNNILTEAMSGRTGTLLVFIVIFICFTAATYTVFSAWQIHNIAKEAGAYGTAADEPQKTEAEPPLTDPPQTEHPQTEPPQTEPPQTEPPQTEPPQTEPPQTEPPQTDKDIVIVDAGHGYDDPGTDADALKDWSEKDITLDIALRLGAILEVEGCEVVYTRKDDTIPKNAKLNANGLYLLNAYDREKIMNTHLNAGAFVSVHCDHYEADPNVNGARIFYYKYNGKSTYLLASDIASGIEDALNLKNKTGVTPPSVQWMAEDAFYLTKCTGIPSVLIETGFVTNKIDVGNFLNEDWRQDMAQGIAVGVLSFLRLK